ncbi:hypothetical protein ASG47_07325 [Devosia sp. Leaf420]|uniref:DUF6538 domain-containing protein n=1 Tax=Devosia sp. Leaf420 TaxID=1736374 RepID=UPI0007156BB7|nr:DUF6538 domain-containing protein [Devosia sp. Leaf420]KQT48174.1 hypothetical protein ASG47_07325 [Devosia sp. Leaf420]
MVLAAARPSVHPRTGIYQFRKVVPERLRALIGKREVKISLGTKDPATARRLHAEVAARVDADWAERELAAAMGQTPPKTLSVQEIEALAGRLYHSHMSRYGDDPVDRDYWLGKLGQAQAVLMPASEPSRRPFGASFAFTPPSMAARLVGGRVSEMLDLLELRIDQQSLSRLHMAATRALAQAYRELAKRASGDLSPDPDAGRFPALANMEKGRAALTPVPWREVHQAYLADVKPAASSIKRQTGVLVAFFSFLGHDDMRLVSEADAERWIEHRLTLVSPRTVRDADMAHPKTLFIWAKRKKRVGHQPFENAKVTVPDEAILRDREFDQDEAERILAATRLPRTKNLTDEGLAARRWIPWILCYTGARVNEVSQARAEDVQERKSRNGEKVWCIRLTPEAGTIKNGKARWVALHPDLLDQGFIDYVKAREGRHLFYDPSRRRDGSDANPQYKKVGESLAHWVRNTVGITDTGVDPNHGWRHLFRSSLLAAGIQEQIIDRIDGHASKTVGQSYGTAWPEVMLAAISKIPAYRVEELK